MHTRRPTVTGRRPSLTLAAAPTPSNAPPERHAASGSQSMLSTANDAHARAESVRVSDVPAGGAGRTYLIERELEQDGNAALQALVADYVDQAERHGVIPMHVPLGRYLAHIED